MNKRGVVAVALGLAIMASGCGTDDEGTSDSITQPSTESATTEVSTESTTAGAGTEGPGGGEPYVIGYNSSQTGGLAYSDVPASRGVQMAIDEINEAGGIDGQWPIELILQDNRSDAGQSAVVAQDLLAEGSQFQICTSDADPCIAAGQIMQDAEIPTMSTAATAPTLPSAVGEFMFMSVFGDNTQTTALANYANELGYENAYLLCSPDSAYTSGSCNYFATVHEANGGTIVGEGSFTLGAASFASEVTRIQGLEPEPDVIFTPAYPPDFPTFAKELRAAGSEIPILSMDGIDSQTTIDAGGAAVEGVVFSTHGFPAEGTPTADFWSAFEDHYGEPPESVFAATGYDLMKIVEAAVIDAQTTDPVVVRDAIDNLESVEVATGTVSYAGQNRVPVKTIYLVEIRDGGFELLNTTNPPPEDIPAP